MIQFSCTCGKQLAADEQYAGKSVKCPQCGNSVGIPGSNLGVQPQGNYGATPPGQHGTPQPPPGHAPQYPSQEPRRNRRRREDEYEDDYRLRRRRDLHETESTSGIAITSFVCGLLSFCIPFLAPLLAILFGFIGLASTGKGKQQGRTFAVVGLVLGFLLLAGHTISTIYMVIGIQTAAKQISKELKKSVKTAAKQMQTSNKLRQIGSAMNSYKSLQGNYPQSAIYDKTGKPLLSWRVQLLPQLGRKDLYDAFHLDEPWDSPHNKKLINQMPSVYQHPDKKRATPGKTYYQVFVTQPGPREGIFVNSPKSKVKLIDITDGTSTTITVVEANGAVTWTQPADIQFKEFGNLKGNLRRPVFGNFVSLLFADGMVRTVDYNRLNNSTLRDLVFRNDGNAVILP